MVYDVSNKKCSDLDNGSLLFQYQHDIKSITIPVDNCAISMNSYYDEMMVILHRTTITVPVHVPVSQMLWFGVSSAEILDQMCFQNSLYPTSDFWHATLHVCTQEVCI